MYVAHAFAQPACWLSQSLLHFKNVVVSTRLAYRNPVSTTPARFALVERRRHRGKPPIIVKNQPPERYPDGYVSDCGANPMIPQAVN